MTNLLPLGGTARQAALGVAAVLCVCLQVRPSAWPARQAAAGGSGAAPAVQAVAPASTSARRVLDRYCVTCHNERLKTADLTLDRTDVTRPAAAADVWEKVVRKVHTGTMPPPGAPQPSQDERGALLTWLSTSLDMAAAERPNPGRTDTLRRLNRTEYQNAIRDLLALDVDASSLLPADESGHGFDNVTLGDLPPALLDRYISAARKISRLAVGRTEPSVDSDVIRLPADLTQEDHLPGLPLGTRGGVSVSHTFVQDGEYEIQIWLARDLTGTVSGLREPRAHELVVLVDRQAVATLTIQKPADGDDTLLDKDLKARVTVPAGPHEIAATFLKDGSSCSKRAGSRFNHISTTDVIRAARRRSARSR